MPDPYNYSIDVANPAQGFMQGLQSAQAMQAQQIAQQQQQGMQRDIADVANNPNPTAQDYARISLKYPQFSAQFQKVWETLSADQQQNKIALGTQVLSALKSGNPDVAQEILQKQAEAMRNSGDEVGARSSEALASTVGINPKAAQDSVAFSLASAMGPKEFSNNLASLFKSQAEGAKLQAEADNAPFKNALDNQKTGAEIGNLNSQVLDRAKRLDLDADKLQTETQIKLQELNAKGDPSLNLSADASKIINDSAARAVLAGQTAGKLTSLADRIEKSGATAGLLGKAAVSLKSALGSQDAVSQLKTEYARLRNSEVMSLLPPGSASDRDVAFALEGFLPDSAPPEQLASFLRGMAKIKAVEETTENAKSEWVNSVGNLGKARKDINVDGVDVAAGTTFKNFMDNYATKAAGKSANNRNAGAVSGRSYMKYAAPTASESPAPVGVY